MESLLVEKRFSSILQSRIQEIETAEVDKSYGTHSFRKGGTTFLGNNAGMENHGAIEKRAGWTRGIIDRYEFSGAGIDQVLGRLLAGYDPFNSDYDSVPLEFDWKALQSAKNENDINNFMLRMVPNYNLYPNGMKTVIPFFLASIINHFDYLRENLSPRHPFWTSSFYHYVLKDGLKPIQPGTMVAEGINFNFKMFKHLDKRIDQLQELMREFIENGTSSPNQQPMEPYTAVFNQLLQKAEDNEKSMKDFFVKISEIISRHDHAEPHSSLLTAPKPTVPVATASINHTTSETAETHQSADTGSDISKVNCITESIINYTSAQGPPEYKGKTIEDIKGWKYSECVEYELFFCFSS